MISFTLESVAATVGNIESSCAQGLFLDKLVGRAPEDQNEQRRELDRVVAARGQDPSYFKKLKVDRDGWLAHIGAICWTRTTATPLSLHLARSNAFENAGLCLHRTYGFAFIPGTGLKGMARAWAETVWLKDQEDKVAARRLIDNVFGWADTPGRRELLNQYPELRRLREEEKKVRELTSSEGAIVFFEAWPESWPALERDILTCHHPDYYGEKDNALPGDWEGPKPISFLTLPPPVTFSFALSKSRSSVDDKLLQQAREWLDAALTYLGAGAKTNSSYGFFEPLPDRATPKALEVRSLNVDLELVTPAFLAGAHQQAEDCNLRGATLRGLLRWWWRTLHAGHLAVEQLRTLEACLWGSSKQGGAIGIRLQALTNPLPVHRFNRAELKPLDPAKRQEIEFREKHHPNAPPRTRDQRKVTQGIQYNSFGMDDGEKHRHVMREGARWRLLITAKPAKLIERVKGQKNPRLIGELSAERVMHEAATALWLLVQYGAVGSKSRKGWGSMDFSGALPAALQRNHSTCLSTAEATRAELKKIWPSKFGHSGKCDTPTLPQSPPLRVTLPWSSPLWTMHQLGFSLALFGASHAHVQEKVALGLPRKMDRPPRLRPPVGNRFASPYTLSLKRSSEGFVVSFLTFETPYLPDLQTSRKWLGLLHDHLKKDLELRAKHFTNQEMDWPRTAAAAFGQRTGTTPSGPSKLPSGQRVKAVLLEEKTKKNGWKAKAQGSWLNDTGHILNTEEVPPTKQPGDVVDLIVHSDAPVFRWPTATDEEKAKQPPKTQQKPHGNRPPYPGKGHRR